MSVQLTHPQLMKHLAQTHFRSLITVNNITTTYDAANEPVITYATDPELTDIPAYIEPMIGANEMRRSDQTVVVNGYNILLAGYYPSIGHENVLTDQLDRVFNIIAVGCDDTQSTTWIKAERVDPPVNDNA